MSLPPAPDDSALPFHVERLGVRGRVVRLGAVAARIVAGHSLPLAAEALVCEAAALAGLIGTSLKFDGLVTVQARGRGPAAMFVADFETPGRLRGYAGLADPGHPALVDARSPLGDLMGEGSFAVTIDPGGDMNRYQGVVPLDPRGIGPSAEDYFERSEQIATRVRLAAGRVTGADGREAWRAGGLLIQHVPRDPATPPGADWEKAALFAETVEAHELLDPTLSAERLLYRLFHEDGVRVFAPQPLAFGCRCSRERLKAVLDTYAAAEVAAMADGDGVLRARCEFCGCAYDFAPGEAGAA